MTKAEAQGRKRLDPCSVVPQNYGVWAKVGAIAVLGILGTYATSAVAEGPPAPPKKVVFPLLKKPPPPAAAQKMTHAEATRFMEIVARRESNAQRPGVMHDHETGLTYDGHPIDFATGKLTGVPRNLSAASK